MTIDFSKIIDASKGKFYNIQTDMCKMGKEGVSKSLFARSIFCNNSSTWSDILKTLTPN